MDKTTDSKSDAVDMRKRFIQLHKEGNNYFKIAEICGVTHQTVRKYVDAEIGKPKRKYNRSVLNCSTSEPYVPKVHTKVLQLNTEIKDLKTELKSVQKLYQK